LNYYLTLFTPYTYLGFQGCGCLVVGLPNSVAKRASEIQIGDVFIGYLTGVSRWCGVFDVTSEMYRDKSPIFSPRADRYVLRFAVAPRVALEPELAIPVSALWSVLERTKGVDRSKTGWAYRARMSTSLSKINFEDAQKLIQELTRQNNSPIAYELTETDRRFLLLNAKKLEDDKTQAKRKQIDGL